MRARERQALQFRWRAPASFLLIWHRRIGLENIHRDPVTCDRMLNSTDSLRLRLASHLPQSGFRSALVRDFQIGKFPQPAIYDGRWTPSHQKFASMLQHNCHKSQCGAARDVLFVWQSIHEPAREGEAMTLNRALGAVRRGG